ncbi:MAG: hypothetical protein PVJ83_02195 [Gammaproteobacteria bacterium]
MISMRWIACLFGLLPAAGNAYESRLSGFTAAEIRGFFEDARFPHQFDGMQASLIVQPEFTWLKDDADDQYSFIPFVQLDSQDNRRTHADVRELYWRRLGPDWEWLVGVNRVFWGVAESRHLVDIINQTDLVEDLDGEDKLGQPMLNLSSQRDWGTLDFYLMPWFRERTFPGKHGRLRFPLVTDGDARYQSSQEQHHLDVALRYAHYVGDWDFGIYYFNGTGREPRFVPDAGGNRLVPVYDLIKQVGTDIQLTRGAWLWKFEGLWRAQHGDHYAAAVGGFEYTLYQIASSDADLGLLLEYSRDGRSDDPQRQPPVLLDDDFFFGSRLTFNDVSDSTVLAGMTVDRDTHAIQLSVEAERRLNNHWKAELEGIWFVSDGDDDLAAVFRNDSYVTLRLARYF